MICCCSRTWLVPGPSQSPDHDLIVMLKRLEMTLDAKPPKKLNVKHLLAEGQRTYFRPILER